MIQKIEFRAGIFRERTEYANSGGWYDADKIRFRAGYPEKIGGWQAVTRIPFAGTCRALHQWTSVEFDRYVALGTSEKLYILWGNNYYDITPIRKEQGPLAAPAICTHLAPNTLRVNGPLHGMSQPGDWVRISGVVDRAGPLPAVDTFTAAVLNGEHKVTGLIDDNTFTIQVPGTMTAPNICGGGAAVHLTYQISVGSDTAVIGTGWGVPPWGGGNTIALGPPPVFPPDPDPSSKWAGWGMGFDPRLLNPTGFDVNQIRLWSLDNFGEDLVANVRGGPVYYWHQAQGVNTPAAPITQAVTVGVDTFTPNWAPTAAVQVLVSPNDRHLIALGANIEGVAGSDPLFVRWSDQENAYEWEPRRDTTAGDQRLSLGSYIISGLRTRQEILIWTDLGLWSMKYIGTPYTFGFDVIAEGLSIIGPNAAVNAGNMLFWMDRGIFYAYTGQVQELPCTVKDYIFSDFNFTQDYKVCTGHNHSFSEVIWFYPSAASDEIDRYALYNYVDQNWSIGKLERTAWLDMGRSAYPIAANRNFHLLYYHELGTDADGSVLPAYVESSDIDQGGGDHFLFLSRMIPDVQFRGTGRAQTVGISVLKRDVALGPKDVAARFTVSQVGEQASVRVRARQISFRVESNHLGVGWRLGMLRGDLQPDGKR